MKTPIRLLLASAALILTTTAQHCLAASPEVAIALSGTIQSGKDLVFTSGTNEIEPAHVYYYAITGSCHGVNNLAFIPDESFATALGVVDPNLVPYLSGTVVDAKGTFPFTAVNKKAKGTLGIAEGPLTLKVTGQLTGEAGIESDGVCYGGFNKLSFTVNGHADTTDGLVLDAGSQCVVGVAPLADGPNLSFESKAPLPPGQLLGIGLTGTATAGHSDDVELARHKTATAPFVLVNGGTGAATFTLSVTPVGAGFKQTIMYGTKNITNAVLAGTYTFPPMKGHTVETLASGAASNAFTWKLQNTAAVSGTTTSPVLTAVGASGVTGTDSLVLTGSAE